MSIEFKPFFKKISDFTNQSTILKSDILLCAKQDVSNKYSTFKIRFEDIIKSFAKSFNNTYDDKIYFYPKGKWNFNKLFIKIPEETLSVDFLNNKDDFESYKYYAINYNFVKEQLLKKLSDLSANYFGYYESTDTAPVWKQKLPSYIGMVIINDRLSSENDVKAIYGEDTSWQQIKARYLLGCGSVDENNNVFGYGNTSIGELNTTCYMQGGSYEIPVDELDIPRHSHCFNKNSETQFVAPNFKKFPEYQLTNNDSAIVFNPKTTFNISFPHINTGELPIKASTVENTKQAHTFALSAKPNLNIITYNDADQTVFVKFKPELEIGEDAFLDSDMYGYVNRKNKKPHSNLHSYYPAYIWERTK